MRVNPKTMTEKAFFSSQFVKLDAPITNKIVILADFNLSDNDD